MGLDINHHFWRTVNHLWSGNKWRCRNVCQIVEYQRKHMVWCFYGYFWTGYVNTFVDSAKKEKSMINENPGYAGIFF